MAKEAGSFGQKPASIRSSLLLRPPSKAQLAGPSFFKEAFRPPSSCKEPFRAPSSSKEPCKGSVLLQGALQGSVLPLARSRLLPWPKPASSFGESRLLLGQSRLTPAEPASSSQSRLTPASFWPGRSRLTPAYAGFSWPGRRAGLRRLTPASFGQRAASFQGQLCCPSYREPAAARGGTRRGAKGASPQ